jgi:hypothetical protein
MIHPPVQEQPGRERLGLPNPEALEPRERGLRDVNPEPVREARPVRNRRPPIRFRDENYEYNLEENLEE